MTDNIGGAIPQSVIPNIVIEEAKPQAEEFNPEIVQIQWDLPYRTSLGQRANTLAPVLWRLSHATYGAPEWNGALQDPRLRDSMERCYKLAEVVIRMIDVVTGYQQ